MGVYEIRGVYLKIRLEAILLKTVVDERQAKQKKKEAKIDLRFYSIQFS